MNVEVLVRQNHAARERAAKRAALLDERKKCELRGQLDRLPGIDGELEALGPVEAVVDIGAERARALAELERQELIAALIRERDGYVKRGLADRAELVSQELRRLGAEGKAPAKRAAKRTAGRTARAHR